MAVVGQVLPKVTSKGLDLPLVIQALARSTHIEVGALAFGKAAVGGMRGNVRHPIHGYRAVVVVGLQCCS